MKKSKRILSLLTALTITASAFASIVIPASAAETPISGADYTFESYVVDVAEVKDKEGNITTPGVESGVANDWVKSGGNAANYFAMTIVQDATLNSKVLYTGLDNQTGGRTMTVKLPTAITPANDPVRVEFDWYSKTTGQNDWTETVIADEDGKQIVSFADAAADTILFNGTTVDSLTRGWYKVSAILDFETKTVIKATITANGESTPAATFSDIAFIDTAAAKVGGLYLNGHRSGNLYLDWRIDNFKAYTVTGEYNKVELTILDRATEPAPVEGATVTLGTRTYTTGADGKVATKLPDGTYNYTVHKAGYEATVGGENDATGSVTVDGVAVSQNISFAPMSYAPQPETVTMTGGQAVMTAPHTAASVTSKTFGVTVIDQKGVALTDGTIEWSIAPADANVSIDNGVVTVTKGFNAGGTHVKDFTVTAKVTKNGVSKSATADLDISDYLFYEPGVNGSSYGTVETATVSDVKYISTPNSTRGKKTEIVLPDPITFTPGTAEILTFKTAVTNVTGAVFKRTITFTDDSETPETIVSLGYIDTTIGNASDATSSWSNKDGCSFNEGADYATLSGANAWMDVAMLMKTNATGATSIKLTFGTGEDAVSYDLGKTDAKNLAKISLLYDLANPNDRYVVFKDFVVDTVDVTGMAISGPDNFTSITGATVEKEYEIDAMVIQDDETLAWSTDKSADGVTITPSADTLSATLSVPGTFTGTIKVSAVSSTSTEQAPKKADKEVTIAAATAESAEIVGTKTVHYVEGATESYTLTNVKDQNGDDITEYVNPTWSLKDRTPVTLPKATLTVDASAVGDAVAIFPVYEGTALKSVTTAPVKITGTSVDIEGKNGQKVLLWNSLDGIKPLAAAGTITGDDVDNVNYITNTGVLNLNVKQDETVVATVLGKPIEQPVKIDTYYLELTSEDIAEGKVYISSLVTDDAISGYQVSTKTGDAVATTVVSKTAVTDDKIAITGTPEEIEIAPVYTISSDIPTTDYRGTFLLPADTYNFTSVLTSGSNRTDIYANDQLLVNNMFQYGSTPDTEVTHDIYVKEGYIDMYTHDYGDGKASKDVKITSLSVVKAPTLAARVPKIYVLGDSLVCKYYNGDKTKDASADDKLKQTGWGQVLQNYIKDDYEVVDIANSGVTAAGLASSAITQVVESAKAGDIVLLESGYNDKQHSNETEMKNALRKMISETPAGVDIILISPNASMHDFNDSVQYTKYMKDIADEQKTKYINLAKLSNDFLADRYDKDTFCKDGDPTTAGTQVNEMSKIWNVSDRLHSTLNAAYKWASVVATELGNLGYSDIIDTEFIYTFDDVLTLNDLAVGTKGTVTCQATVTTAD